jgi:hypothetical protein
MRDGRSEGEDDCLTVGGGIERRTDGKEADEGIDGGTDGGSGDGVGAGTSWKDLCRWGRYTRGTGTADEF